MTTEDVATAVVDGEAVIGAIETLGVEATCKRIVDLLSGELDERRALNALALSLALNQVVLDKCGRFFRRA